MLKSNGGNGTVQNCVFSNFIGHNTAYSLDLNAYWSDSTDYPGDGVFYTGLTFSNWKGDCAAGTTRAPIQLLCPSTEPCTGLIIENFNMWTDSGSKEYYKCENAWGNGPCLRGGSQHTSYAISTVTVTAAPTSWSASYMPSDLATGFALSSSIPIPTVPTSFFPGQTPATKRAYP